MSVLRMIKLFGWEAKVEQQVDEKREAELKATWKKFLWDLVLDNLKYV